MKLIGVVMMLFLMSFTSALYSNPNLPTVPSPTTTVTAVSSGGSNSTFNETYNNILGQTCPIGQVVNGTLSNGTIKCQVVTASMTNIFDQNLNTTNNVQFVNITTTDRFLSTVAGVSGVWHSYYVLGTALEIGRVTSELGVFQVKSLANLDIYFSNDDTTGFFAVFDNGNTVARSLTNFFVDDGTTRFIESNKTRTTIANNFTVNGSISNFTNNIFVRGNVSIKGTYNDLAVSNGRINATEVNITSNHQSYNVTSSHALDTTYTNTLDRPIYIDMSFTTALTDDVSTTYVTMYVNGIYCSREGISDNSARGNSLVIQDWHHLGCPVQPNQKYSFNTTLTSSGSATLESVWRFVI